MTALPPAVEEMLRNNNLLHLATSHDDVPSVSLMSFSFVPSSSGSPPTVILSSKPTTQKVVNIKSNPRVSLLIHDWTSNQEKSSLRGTTNTGSQLSGGSLASAASTNISQFLEKLNQSQFSQRSVTLNGNARIPAGEEAEYYREKHLQSNPSAACFIKNADIILVVPHQVKVSDSSSNVQVIDL